jgi:hypothetical protein
MKRNTNNNIYKPSYIFAENKNKNNIISLDRKTLNYQGITATIKHHNGSIKPIVIEFDASFKDFGEFIDLAKKEAELYKHSKYQPKGLKFDKTILYRHLNLNILPLINEKSAIYMFTNNVNKKIYIGKTTRLNERIKNYSDSH